MPPASTCARVTPSRREQPRGHRLALRRDSATFASSDPVASVWPTMATRRPGRRRATRRARQAASPPGASSAEPEAKARPSSTTRPSASSRAPSVLGADEGRRRSGAVGRGVGSAVGTGRRATRRPRRSGRVRADLDRLDEARGAARLTRRLSATPSPRADEVAEVAEVHEHGGRRHHLDPGAEVEAAAALVGAVEQHLEPLRLDLRAQRRHQRERGPRLGHLPGPPRDRPLRHGERQRAVRPGGASWLRAANCRASLRCWGCRYCRPQPISCLRAIPTGRAASWLRRCASAQYGAPF